MRLVKSIFRYTLLAGTTMFSTLVYSQETKASDSIIITEEIYENLIEVRNYLHANPELSGEEKITSSFIEKYLKDLGLEVKTNIGGYGVVGILNGDKKGRRIAWRADIDAIPLHSHHEDESHNSDAEAIHNCGHDVHTTIGLGIAKVLAGQKDRIQGTVYFIFQPSEENYQGAKAMIADGLFDIIKPDEIYAVHISPMPVGLLATKPNYLFADYKQINLTFKKVKDRDALIKYVKNLVSGFQNVAPDSDFWKMQSLMQPDIGIGNPNTIFKDYTTVENNFDVSEKGNKITISAYLSTSNSELMNNLPKQLQEKIELSSYAKKLKKIEFGSNKFAYSNQRGNVNNNPTLAQKALDVFSAIPDKSITSVPLYGVIPDGRGDDFAYFQEKVPGVYFFLGGSNFEKGIISMPHAPNFSIDKKAIKVGVKAFSVLIIDRVNDRK